MKVLLSKLKVRFLDDEWEKDWIYLTCNADEQISDAIRRQYKGATGGEFPIADK